MIIFQKHTVSTDAVAVTKRRVTLAPSGSRKTYDVTMREYDIIKELSTYQFGTIGGASRWFEAQTRQRSLSSIPNLSKKVS